MEWLKLLAWSAVMVGYLGVEAGFNSATLIAKAMTTMML